MPLGLILAANGPVFSAGHNFGDMKGASLEDARHLFVCTEMMDTLQDIPQPVCAKVHALATAAGCQLVASCDLAVASEDAAFAIPGGKGGLFCHTRWSRWPATSAASGPWRWRSPATRSTPALPPSGVS